MELKYPLALYICAGVAALFVIAAFITIRVRRKYKGGKKAFLPDYLKKLSSYKSRIVWYTILKYVLIVLIIASILLAGFLMSRPYKTESKELANYNRDILLCMDISTTCDNLNAVLIDKLEDMVRELNGEKFGIVIFNTSPVLLVHLTNDYNYVIEVLEQIKEALEMRIDYYNGKIIFSDRLYELDAFISNGTLIDYETRGSSLIGDGLAAASLDFYDFEENPDRTRCIIFSTDNDLFGEPYFTLPEAGDLCNKRNIIVYGIGTEDMRDVDRKEMKETVESTGGSFFYGEDSKVVEGIVAEIRSQLATLDETQYEIVETELPETPFKLLLFSLSMMLLLAFILKV